MLLAETDMTVAVKSGGEEWTVGGAAKVSGAGAGAGAVHLLGGCNDRWT
jgi:hypothetical protein